MFLDNLNESVKRFIKSDVKLNPTSFVHQNNVINNLSRATNTINYDELEQNISASFFDGKDQVDIENILLQNQVLTTSEIIHRQALRINKYREISMLPEVSDAIEEIINDAVSKKAKNDLLNIYCDIDNQKLVKKIEESFEKIIKLLNFENKAYNIIRNSYIDGQLVLHCTYDKNIKKGIQKIQMIDPRYFHWDNEIKKWKYTKMNEDSFSALSSMQIMRDNTKENDMLTYSPEEIIKDDFGLSSDGIILSYLEYAIKPANMLKTLEDLLIPLRFSRSISRRVFNVDMGDIPTKRAKEIMDDYQEKFGYKKFYNSRTGEVHNQQHITSMFEDYWFSNRNGSRGTSVDTIDESGNLGELRDIEYFARKLYRSMNVPTSRINLSGDNYSQFDFSTNIINQEDVKFFYFVKRIRSLYTNSIKELLKRELIATNILKLEEWKRIQDSINIVFINENIFLENMYNQLLLQKIEFFNAAKDEIGKIFSVQDLMKRIFDMNETNIDDLMKEIYNERKDKRFATFYNDLNQNVPFEKIDRYEKESQTTLGKKFGNYNSDMRNPEELNNQDSDDTEDDYEETPED